MKAYALALMGLAIVTTAIYLLRRRPALPPLKPIARPVWFFLLEVEVIGDTKQLWTRGSRALVQALAPGDRLEDTLMKMDAFLATEELRRLDTRTAVRYEPSDEEPDYVGSVFQRELEQAAEEDRCVLGVFFLSEETSKLREDAEEVREDPPREPLPFPPKEPR